LHLGVSWAKFDTSDLGYQILYLKSKKVDNFLEFQRINGTIKRISIEKSARTTKIRTVSRRAISLQVHWEYKMALLAKHVTCSYIYTYV
jgi:hypothetical protein